MEEMLLDSKHHIINAETVKSLVLDKLLKHDVLTKDQYDEYYSEYQVIIIKPNWFKSWINKFKSEAEKGYVYKYVKF